MPDAHRAASRGHARFAQLQAVAGQLGRAADANVLARMHNPPHPGATLRDDVLPALGLSVTDVAAALGVTRPALSRVLNGRASVSPAMALRLDRWLGIDHDGRAKVWLHMQAAHDLAAAAKAAAPWLKKIKPVERARLAG